MHSLVSECAQYEQKASIHELSVYKLWNQLVSVHLLSRFGSDISDNKVWAALKSS